MVEGIVKYSVHLDAIASRLSDVRSDKSAREVARLVAPFLGKEPAHSSVLDYEKGTEPPATYLAAFCTAFDVTPEWLLYGTGPRLARRESLVSLAAQIHEKIVDLTRDPSLSPDEVEDLLRRGLQWLQGEAPAGA